MGAALVAVTGGAATASDPSGGYTYRPLSALDGLTDPRRVRRQMGAGRPNAGTLDPSNGLLQRLYGALQGPVFSHGALA